MDNQLSLETCVEVTELLVKVAKQFRDYETNHLAKVRTIPNTCNPTDARILEKANEDALNKAKTNRVMAEEVEEFLRKSNLTVALPNTTVEG